MDTSSSILPPSAFPLRLSQGHLNLLSTCPRKFQHLFLDHLGSPSTPEQQEKQNQGTRFHLLLQQWQLGLAIEPFIQQDQQLQGWFDAFTAAASEILELNPGHDETLRQSEHERILEYQGYLLTVRYDLLISNAQQAKILDWKTYPRPQNSRWLQQNWQTRLYLFALAETSSYTPEQLSMVYWFFQTQAGETQKPQSLTFSYHHTQHEQTRQDLTYLLNQLTHWLERYQVGEPFPKIAPSSRQCEDCSFAVRCDRVASRHENRVASRSNTQEEAWSKDSITQPNLTLPQSLPDLATIQEIPI